MATGAGGAGAGGLEPPRSEGIGGYLGLETTLAWPSEEAVKPIVKLCPISTIFDVLWLARHRRSL